jgi:hypothetical protein
MQSLAIHGGYRIQFVSSAGQLRMEKVGSGKPQRSLRRIFNAAPC